MPVLLPHPDPGTKASLGQMRPWSEPALSLHLASALESSTNKLIVLTWRRAPAGSTAPAAVGRILGWDRCQLGCQGDTRGTPERRHSPVTH